MADIFDKPFDEGTKLKLKIFEDYTQAWIPTFIMSPTCREVIICDFFAGAGKDINGVYGSPLCILKKIGEQLGNIFRTKTRIKVILNELDPGKFQSLKANVDNYLLDNPEILRLCKAQVDIEFYNQRFEDLFERSIADIAKVPSLLFLDQNGLKFLSPKYLHRLATLSTVDYIYFVSSSFIWRFADTEELQIHIGSDINKVKKFDYKYIHVTLLTLLKANLPKLAKTRIYPFSIKKGSAIYGIYFGASHPRAFDKYLKVAWKLNEVNGSANFDIDDEFSIGQLDLFKGQRLSKIATFQAALRKEILEETVRTNQDALEFSYEHGHLPSHAQDLVKNMKHEKLLTFEGISPLVNYDNVYKERRVVTFQLLK